MFALWPYLWSLTYKQYCVFNVQVCTICIWSTGVPNFACHGTVVHQLPSWDWRLKKIFTRPPSCVCSPYKNISSVEMFRNCISQLHLRHWMTRRQYRTRLASSPVRHVFVTDCRKLTKRSNGFQCHNIDAKLVQIWNERNSHRHIHRYLPFLF
jgi:hypothetical protein